MSFVGEDECTLVLEIDDWIAMICNDIFFFIDQGHYSNECHFLKDDWNGS